MGCKNFWLNCHTLRRPNIRKEIFNHQNVRPYFLGVLLYLFFGHDKAYDCIRDQPELWF